MKPIEKKSVEAEFFGLLRKLISLLEGNTWWFWYRAFKRFLSKKPPFVADEEDVSIATEPCFLSILGILDAVKTTFGSSVIGSETAELLLDHSDALQTYAQKFVVGTAADLFGLDGEVPDDVFYSEKIINSYGLDFCRPEDAVVIRNKLVDQEPGGGLTIITKPLSCRDGNYYYFEVLRYLPHHHDSKAFRIIRSRTEANMHRVGRMMVFRLKGST